MCADLRNKKGLTLIELLVALTISSILIAGIYRTFIGQQKTYTVQEQVVDVQQNLRAVTNKMIREIRMAGFGNVSDVSPVNGFPQVITMTPSDITIVGAFKQIRDASGNPITIVSTNANQITLSAATSALNGDLNKYLSIGGIGSYTVTNQPTGTTNVLTLDRTPKNAVGAYLYKVQAVTYAVGYTDGKPVLQRNGNDGTGPEDLAGNIESLQFEYLDKDGNVTAIAGNVRRIRLTVTAKTETIDPDLQGGDGYRRRTISSSIQLRNLGWTL